MYTPEQDMMAWGHVRTRDSDNGTGPAAFHVSGTTKTMRKIQPGDILAFISFCDTANGATVNGAVQFFCKT